MISLIVSPNFSAHFQTHSKFSSFLQLERASLVAVAVLLAVITSTVFPWRYLLRLFVFDNIIFSTTNPIKKSKSHMAFNNALLSVYVLGSWSFVKWSNAFTMWGNCSTTAFTASSTRPPCYTLRFNCPWDLFSVDHDAFFFLLFFFLQRNQIHVMVYWSLGKIHYIIVSRCKEEGSLIRLINPRTVNYLFVHYEKDDGFDCNLWITSIEKPFPPIRRNNSKRTFDQNRRKYKYEHSDLHDTIQITCELILNKEYNATTKERKSQIEINIYIQKKI